jgi:outer membrane protein OmpA-like peptidoglycan-associated protein
MGIFLLACVFLMIGSSQVFAQNCQIIRIDDASKVYKGTTETGATSLEGVKLRIFPEKVTVPVGTCTVWISWLDQGDIQVSFVEGTKACVFSAEGFIQKEVKPGEACYIAEKVGKGKTASLTWEKPGVYTYTVELIAATIGREKPMTEGVVEVIGPEKAEVAAMPVDSDGDGVPDSEDLCPDTPIGATVNKKGCWALKGMLVFDFDSSTIKPEAHRVLDEVATILKNNPEIKGEIRGHTDSTGPADYNMQLSEKRAMAVDEYLENKGIDPSRWTIKGYGASQPLESNETPEGRQENRRVELVRTK